MSKLIIMTLNWDGEDKLKKLIPSVLPALKNISWEWLIKDNASKDKSVEYIDSLNNPNIKVIRYKDNQQNFSAGMNYLFHAAAPQDNDYVLLLNNDIIFNDTTSIKKMIDIMEKDITVGAVGARLLYTKTNIIQHAGVFFNPIYKTPIHFRAGQKTDSDAERNRIFQAVTGAVLLTKAEYFKNTFKNKSGICGMDENYQWAFDDTDLCLSITHNMNKKVVYCGETNIYHEESSSLKKNPVNKMFMTHNVVYLKNKWQNKCIFDQKEYAKDVRYNLYRGKE